MSGKDGDKFMEEPGLEFSLLSSFAADFFGA